MTVTGVLAEVVLGQIIVVLVMVACVLGSIMGVQSTARRRIRERNTDMEAHLAQFERARHARDEVV